MNPILIVMTFVSFVLTMAIRYGAQAMVTTLLGDGSPAKERRLTLNPARHMATLGTFVALALSFPIGAYVPAGLGWGRPVKPDVRRLSVGANTGMILVALTGIAVNFIVGIVIAVGLGFIPFTHGDFNIVVNCLGLQGGPFQGCLQAWQPGWALRLEQFAFVFASVNILVGLLNIIPLYPLDGSKILFAVLPDRQAIGYRNSEATQELILFGILLFLPFLLSLAGLPATYAPSYLLQSLSFKIMGVFGNYINYFQAVVENL